MTEEKEYRIEYRLEEDDLRRVHGTLASSSGLPSVWFWITSLVVILPIVPFIFVIIDGMPFGPPLIGGYLLMVTIGIVMSVSIWRAQSRQLQKWIESQEMRRFLLKTTCTIQQQGIRIETPLNELSLAWPVFEKLESTADERYVLFWIGKGQAVIIPARAFANKEAMFAFLEFAKDFHSQYVGGKTVCPACNYDLRGDPMTGCPECGWMRTKDEHSGDVA